MKLLRDKRKVVKRQGRARKGEGSLRLKNGIWYYRIADPLRSGKQIEGSCQTGDYEKAMAAKAEAIRKLKETAGPKSATVADILDGYYARLKKKAGYAMEAEPDSSADYNASQVLGKLNRLKAVLGDIPANALTTADTDRYRAEREKSVLFTTVNGELAYLRAAYKMELRHAAHARVSSVPYIWFPPEESQIREGFLYRDETYAQIYQALPDSLKALFVVGFHTGARIGELKKLRWPMVRWDDNQIEIRAKTAKNKKGRWLPIWGDMRSVLEWQKEIHDRECPETPWVFFWHKAHRGQMTVAGAQIKHPEESWDKAVAAIGLPDLIFHDMRRSAIRYATQDAGIDEAVVRTMSGHRSPSVFDRYNIRGARQVVQMGTALDAHLESTGGPRLPLENSEAHDEAKSASSFGRP